MAKIVLIIFGIIIIILFCPNKIYPDKKKHINFEIKKLL